MEGSESLRVLLVEDNPSDVIMLREALASAGLAVELEVFWNGQDVLDRLRSQSEVAAASRPDVVVLDVNLPILNGREVFAAMIADRDLSSIPIVILTGSRFEKESFEVHPAGRCVFVVKPFDFLSLVEVARRIVGFAHTFRGVAWISRLGEPP